MRPARLDAPPVGRRTDMGGSGASGEGRRSCRCTAAARRCALLAGCGGGAGGALRPKCAPSRVAGPSPRRTDTTAASSCDGFCADTPTFLTPQMWSRSLPRSSPRRRPRASPAPAVVDPGRQCACRVSHDGAEPFVTVTSTADGSAPDRRTREREHRAGRARGHRQGDHGRLSVDGRQRLHDPYCESDRPEHFNPESSISHRVRSSACSSASCPAAISVWLHARQPARPGAHRSPPACRRIPVACRSTSAARRSGGSDSSPTGSTARQVHRRLRLDPDELAPSRAPSALRPWIVWAIRSRSSARPSATPTSGSSSSDGRGHGADFRRMVAREAASSCRRRLLRCRGGAQGTPSGMRRNRPPPPASSSIRRPISMPSCSSTTTTRRPLPPRPGRAGGAPPTPSAQEVRTLLANASVANRAPPRSAAPVDAGRVTVPSSPPTAHSAWRVRDGPVFGADVSLQKARTAAFYSGTGGSAVPRPPTSCSLARRSISRGGGLHALLADPLNELIRSSRRHRPLGPIRRPADLPRHSARPRGGRAAGRFADRSGGNLSRPFYPDGVEARPPAPLSSPATRWACSPWACSSIWSTTTSSSTSPSRSASFPTWAGLPGNAASCSRTTGGGA